MTTLFISDLHLDESRPHITRLFLGFLERDASRADALYILGDLFEAWIGDDAPGEVGDRVAEGLAHLHRRGVPSFFIHGNRDFLLGDAFARRACMTLLPDPSEIRIGSDIVLLTHGDALCVDDVPYQAFRAETRGAAWQRAFLAKPVAERARFAEQARAESKRYTRSVADAITDVNHEAVMNAFDRHSTRRIIHGHTHRPAVHRLDAGGAKLERVVLGDWYEQGSVLTCDDDRFALATL
jgi:UDP-2,3-diacylglucosamine hydrolase